MVMKLSVDFDWQEKPRCIQVGSPLCEVLIGPGYDIDKRRDFIEVTVKTFNEETKTIKVFKDSDMEVSP